MVFTKQEEDILKKMVEIQKIRNQWNNINEDFGTQVRAASNAKRTELKDLLDSMNSKMEDLRNKETELKALVEG